MATVSEEEADYESDPEEAKRSLAMRRREASDDEEGEGERRDKSGVDPRVGRQSDESDEEGGAAEYDEEEELGVEDEEEEVVDEENIEEKEDEEEEVVDEEGEGEGRDKSGVDPRVGRQSDESDEEGGAAEYDEEEELGVEDEEKEVVDEENIEEKEDEEEEVVDEENIEEKEDEEEEVDHVSEAADGVESSAIKYGDGGRSMEEPVEAYVGKNVVEEEKKEKEPFAVPTAGAFYMHDDRFRDDAGGGHRQTHGGQKLWESKDNMKWGHDKFEEMTLQERHSEEGRRSSKGYQGRGRSRHIGCDYGRGNKSNAFNNVSDQSPVSKGVRGKGFKKYEQTMKNNNQIPLSQNKQSGRPSAKRLEKPLNINSGKAPTPASYSESNLVPARKNVLASCLNSASPPFYPGSSNKDIALSQKRDAPAGRTNRNFRPPIVDESFSMPQTSTALRGKNVADSLNMDRLYIEDSINSDSGKAIKNLQIPPSGLPVVNTTPPPKVRPQGRVFIPGQSCQPSALPAQVMKASSLEQVHSIERSGAQSGGQSTVQTPAQQLGRHLGSGSQAISPPKTALSSNSHESGEIESSSVSSEAKTSLVGKGKGISQGSAIMYGEAQVVGATGSMGVSHGDQNFPGTPAFLQVMQFGGQRPGGIQVPAVGMAFPGYVTQPQLGLGNSEMTWLPVLASATGTLGATYCSPYIAVDGSYHARPSGQIASGSVLSGENNANQPNNAERPEIVNDEFGQRLNKPRRYSEMNFGQ